MSPFRISRPLAFVVLCASLSFAAQDKPAMQDSERKIKEAEVPKAALEALKKVAANAAFTEFAEEIEHGHKFYEGTYKGPNGNIDALVTDSGDLVEIEESIPAEMAPAAVRAAAEKSAGKDAKVRFEKKTMIVYEIHYSKDGKGRETILSPDGRELHEEHGAADESKPGDKGKDDDDDDK